MELDRQPAQMIRSVLREKSQLVVDSSLVVPTVIRSVTGGVSCPVAHQPPVLGHPSQSSDMFPSHVLPLGIGITFFLPSVPPNQTKRHAAIKPQ